jgi:membrane protein implicated in regulation of membrane protease activity
MGLGMDLNYDVVEKSPGLAITLTIAIFSVVALACCMLLRPTNRRREDDDLKTEGGFESGDPRGLKEIADSARTK